METFEYQKSGLFHVERKSNKLKRRYKIIKKFGGNSK